MSILYQLISRYYIKIDIFMICSDAEAELRGACDRSRGPATDLRELQRL